jgi:hypothetical protein
VTIDEDVRFVAQLDLNLAEQLAQGRDAQVDLLNIGRRSSL